MAKSIEARGRCSVCHKQMPDPDDLTEMWYERAIGGGHIVAKAEPISVCTAKECRAAAEARGYSTERHVRRSI
jgi:hypothetical protein